MLKRLIALFLICGGIALLTFGADSPGKSSPGVIPLADPPGIHNLFRLATNLYSGSVPDGEQGFAALAELGVKSIITVDGAKPDLESARKFGMRYVHLPHGYDGIGSNVQVQLAKAAEVLPGPIYVHCHHGKHRGPAAAAIICMAREGWSPRQAEAWLASAGTATNYSGLYEVVRHFQKPTVEQLKAASVDLPETSPVPGLVDAMIEIDARWEALKAARAASYQAPPNHPDLRPANEVVILWEHYREAQRLPDSAQRGADFLDRLTTAERQAIAAEQLLRQFDSSKSPDVRAQLDKAFDAMAKTCASCHKAYRDPAGIKSKSK
jgi:hypothetical protein